MESLSESLQNKSLHLTCSAAGPSQDPPEHILSQHSDSLTTHDQILICSCFRQLVLH